MDKRRPTTRRRIGGKKKWIIPPFMILALMLVFLMGMFMGQTLEREYMWKNNIRIAEALAGTEFNIEMNLNETLLVDRMFEYFNETDSQSGEEVSK